MRRNSPSESLYSPWWTLTLPLVTLIAMAMSPPERRMWIAPLASAVFAATQFVLPRSRFRTVHYLGPVNVALGLLLIKVVVIPVLIMLVGAESRVLTYLPNFASIQNVILIDLMAYVSFCVGLSVGPDPSRIGGSPLSALAGPGPSGRIVTVFAALGIVGFLAAFGSPARLMAYFFDSTAKLVDEMEGSYVALAGTFLRPFLAFALVAWWSRLVDLSAGYGRLWRITLAGLLAAAGVTIANLTFSFNRAAFVFPLVSLIAVYSARVKRIPVGLAVLAALGAIPMLIAFETMRSNRMIGMETYSDSAFSTVFKDVAENIQGYGGSPQFSAIFCERLGWGERLYGGSTILCSVMSPVPVLGKGFREGSGPTLFNRAIYDVKDIEDQILPFATELFINFHLPGVVAGLIGLGMFLSAAQGWFETAESAFSAFSIQYVAMWGAMLAAWSISIYSQIIIYFFGPIYFYVAVRHVLGRLRTRGYRCRVVSQAGVSV